MRNICESSTNTAETDQTFQPGTFDRVYNLAGALKASAPKITIEQALKLAYLIVETIGVEENEAQLYHDH